MRILVAGKPTFLLAHIVRVGREHGYSVDEWSGTAGAGARWDAVILCVPGVGEVPDVSAEEVLRLADYTAHVCVEPAEPASAATLTARLVLPVGPGDDTGRFTYWPSRVARGGTVLAFDRPGRKLEPFVDVRDAAEWIVGSVRDARTGAFDVAGDDVTVGELIETARALDGSDVQVVYAPEALLIEHGVDNANAFPLCFRTQRPQSELAVRSASDVRLSVRPLKQTMYDALAWEKSNGDQRSPLGLSVEKEAEVLRAVAAQSSHATSDRRQRRARLFWASFNAVLVTAAALALLESKGMLETAIDALRTLDLKAQGVLAAFRPWLLYDLYGEHVDKSGATFGPLTIPNGGDVFTGTLTFLGSIVSGTPWVVAQLYQRGGWPAIWGGICVVLFGLGYWFALPAILRILGRSMPRVFTELQANVDAAPLVAAEWTTFCGFIAILPYLFYRLGMTNPILLILMVALCALYGGMCFLALARVSSPRRNVVDVGAAADLGWLKWPARVLHVALLVYVTAVIGTTISWLLQGLFLAITQSVSALITQLSVMCAGGVFATVLTFLEVLHLGKGGSEVVEDFRGLIVRK